MTGTIGGMPSLEDRVDALERQAQEDRHLTGAHLGGLALGIADVRHDVQQLSLKVDQHHAETTGRLDAVDGRLAHLESDVSTLRADVSEIKTTLAEVLRRLPEPPAP